MTTGLTLPDPDAPWQALHLRELLREVLLDNAGEAAAHMELTLQEIRPTLREALAGRPTRAGFRTGALTVCELVPMRSVPHRVVILLGMDDGVFPRQSVRDGDDLLARDPWIGDRDPRSEDRQLFLEAIGAAGERLIVIYTGHDQRTGAPVPPAVPLGELFDALDRTAVGADGRSARDTVTTHHPLQPFDPRAFITGDMATDRPFSFDPRAYAGAISAAQDRSAPPPLTDAPLPLLTPADVLLEDLVKLLCHPAQGFLRQRLQIRTTDADDALEDSLPLELTALEQWALGDRVLRELLMRRDTDRIRERELARGALPPGPLGTQQLSIVGPRAEAIARATDALPLDEVESYDIDVDLGDGTRLLGTVNGVRGTCLTTIGYGALSLRHRLSAWLRLLALTVSFPNETWQAVTLGLDRDRTQCARSTLGPVTRMLPTGSSANMWPCTGMACRRRSPFPRAVPKRMPCGVPVGRHRSLPIPKLHDSGTMVGRCQENSLTMRTRCCSVLVHNSRCCCEKPPMPRTISKDGLGMRKATASAC